MSFISPCMLPLLPVYLVYFAGGSEGERKNYSRIFFFVIGFTVSFMILGLVFSVIGRFAGRHQTLVNIICGAAMILFGLHYLEVIRLPFFKGTNSTRPVYSNLSALVFGLVYPINLTPCVGAFLGSALAMAAASGSAMQGAILLFVYSLGLGLPFVLSAFFISHLDVLFNKIKQHYTAVNRVCGIFLIVTGVLIACGLMNRFLNAIVR